MAINVKVVVSGSVRNVRVDDNASVRDAVSEAGVSSDLEVKFRGTRLSDEQQSSTTLEEGDVIIASAPSVKHGA